MGIEIDKIKMNRSTDLADRAATAAPPPCQPSSLSIRKLYLLISSRGPLNQRFLTNAAKISTDQLP